MVFGRGKVSWGVEMVHMNSWPNEFSRSKKPFSRYRRLEKGVSLYGRYPKSLTYRTQILIQFRNLPIRTNGKGIFSIEETVLEISLNMGSVCMVGTRNPGRTDPKFWYSSGIWPKRRMAKEFFKSELLFASYRGYIHTYELRTYVRTYWHTDIKNFIVLNDFSGRINHIQSLWSNKNFPIFR